MESSAKPTFGLLVASMLVFLAAIAMTVYSLGQLRESSHQFMLTRAHAVAEDSAAQYGVAKSKSADKAKLCSLAKDASAMYLMAGDEEQFLQWKKTEVADCDTAQDN